MVGYVKIQLSCILFIMLTTTCFGHYIYIFLWPENGPQWPKHVVSIISRIQESCVWTYPTPSLIGYNTTGMIHLRSVHFSKCQRTAVLVTRSIFRVAISYIKYMNNQKMHFNFMMYQGADKSLARPGRKQARKHVEDARDFNDIETRTVIKAFLPCKPRRRREFTPFWQKH